MNLNEIELDPCPWKCDGELVVEAVGEDEVAVICTECGASGPPHHRTKYQKGEAAAVAAMRNWNGRGEVPYVADQGPAPSESPRARRLRLISEERDASVAGRDIDWDKPLETLDGRVALRQSMVDGIVTVFVANQSWEYRLNGLLGGCEDNPDHRSHLRNVIETPKVKLTAALDGGTVVGPDDSEVYRTGYDVGWDVAPDWAQWWAVDANGQAFWYEKKPDPEGDYFCYQAGTERSFIEQVSPSSTWKISLQQRPKSEDPPEADGIQLPPGVDKIHLDECQVGLDPKAEDPPPKITPSKNSHPIATRISTYLNKNNLSPETANLGVSAQTIRNILAGKGEPTQNTIDKIAAVLNIEVKPPGPPGPPTPARGKKCKGINSPESAARFVRGEVDAWAQGENHPDFKTAARALKLTTRAFSKIVDDGELPHPNIITAIGKVIPSIRANQGVLLRMAKEAV